MGKRTWFAAAIGLWVTLAGLPAAVRADMVQFTYFGHVDSVTSDGSPAPAIHAGDPFQGTLRYDPVALPLTPNPGPYLAFTSPGLLALRIGRWDIHSDPAAPIYLTLVSPIDIAWGGELEWSSVAVRDPGLFQPPASAGYLAIAFNNVGGAVPPATVTARPDLGIANGAGLFLSFPKAAQPVDLADPRFTLQGTITSMSVVDPVATPEPSTLALAAVGILAGGLFARRRARHSNRKRRIATS